MKITKKILREIIEEEMKGLLNESVSMEMIYRQVAAIGNKIGADFSITQGRPPKDLLPRMIHDTLVSISDKLKVDDFPIVGR